MWQRFSEHARKVVFYAQEEAQNFGEGYVSTEHLLLGLCRETDNTACLVIVKCGGSPAGLTAAVRRQLPRGDARSSTDMTLTPRAKRVIDLAYDEARELKNNFIGTEHLLLGLIREQDGLAGRVLEKASIYLDDARAATLVIHKEQGVPSDRPPLADAPEKRSPSNLQVLPIRVRYDLQLLHPTDQLLLAILTDDESEFGRMLRGQAPHLTIMLPSILAVMAQAFVEDRPSFTSVLADAHRVADERGKNEITASELFEACVAGTLPTVRNTLVSLGLNLEGL